MKSFRKRLFSMSLIIFVAAACFAFSSYAVSNTTTYKVDELAMTVDIPTEIKVITRGIRQNDTLFTDGTFDYIQTMYELRKDNIYLLGKNFTKNYDLEIIMTIDDVSNEYGDFKMLSSKKKEELLNSLLSKEETVACSVYSTDSVLYFESLLKHFVDERACFTKEYYTVVDGKNIMVRINSYDDQLTESENAELKAIVDSIIFDKSSNWSFTSSLAGTVICVFVLCLAFIAIAVIKTKELTVSDGKIFGVIHGLNCSEHAQDSNPTTEEDEEESRMILDFLSTDKEIEARNNKENPHISEGESAENDSISEGKNQESIDISVDDITLETTEEDEEITFFTDNELVFNEDESEADIIAGVSNNISEVSEREDESSVSIVKKDDESIDKTTTDEEKDELIGGENITENNEEKSDIEAVDFEENSDEEEVDLAAARLF